MSKKSPAMIFSICGVLLASLMVLMQVVSAEDDLTYPLDSGSPTKEATVYRCPIRGQIVFYAEPNTSSKRLLSYIGQLDIYILGQDESGEWLRVAYFNRQELVMAWAQARFVDLCLPEGETLVVVDVSNPPDLATTDYDDDSDVNANVEPNQSQTANSNPIKTATSTNIPNGITNTPTSTQGVASATPVKNTATLKASDTPQSPSDTPIVPSDTPSDTPTVFQPQFTNTPTDTPTVFQPQFTNTLVPSDTPTVFQPQFTPTLSPTVGPSDTATDTPTVFQPQFTETPSNTPTDTPTFSNPTFIVPP